MKLKYKLFTFILLSLIIGIGFYLYYREGTLPVNKTDKSTKIFVIKKGESLTSVAKNLENQSLIRSRLVFYLVVKQLGIEKKIQAGDFRLSPSMDVYQIAENLTHGTLDVWLTIIEGLRKEEVAHILANELNIPESEFLKYAQEGYLFPDTYLIPRQATAEAVIKILTDNFNRKFNQKLKDEARRKGLTPEETIILASIIEREARFKENRPIVASVLLNRLRIGMKLDIDATVQYALGYQPGLKTWWKKNLTRPDLAVDSAYNTYKNKGLPPGPISNPGLDSIKAVINAPKTDYLYYLSDKQGKMHFAKTLEEHQANIRKYL